MSTKIEAIKDFIEQNIDEDGNVIATDDFDEIENMIAYINEKFKCDIKVKYVGGFESTGYDVNCYAWAAIIDGELYFDSLQHESY
jgi:hypothetical protein